MRIESSRFEGAALHAQRSQTTVQRATVTGGPMTGTRLAGQPAAASGTTRPAGTHAQDLVQLSDEARALSGQARAQSIAQRGPDPAARPAHGRDDALVHVPAPASRPAAGNDGTSTASAVHAQDESRDVDQSLRMLVQVVEWLTGRRVKVFDASDLQPPSPDAAAPQAPVDTQPAESARAASDTQSATTTVIHASYSESESLDVSMQGSVHTADGRDVSFSLSLSMRRSFSASLDMLASSGGQQATDPLVINLDAGAAQLSDRMFRFDLDGDGTAEDLHAPGAGTGFLVFDRNGNGTVDGAGELFGPATSNGFAELAALDDDGNGWIDEGDAAFAKLGVWSAPQTGGGALASLAALGIGALSTQSVAGDFSLKDAANATTGRVRATGAYLRESGEAGTIQQVDLVA